ncbi:MAG: nucleotidyltransferase family protein [Gemmatimonadota bacterium]
MKALILAAGRGTRLAGVAAVPKPLIDVGGTSPLEHALAWVSRQRPERIWINVHAAADMIRERIGTAVAGVPVSYSYEPELLGTAGAWKRLESEWDGTSLVVYGDNVMEFDLDALLGTHRAVGTAATIAVFDPARHANTGIGGGRVEVDEGRATAFVEGGTTGLINAGAYYLEPELRERLPVGFLDFGHDVLPVLAAAGEVAVHVVEDAGFCLGVDTPERLRLARAMLGAQEVTR